MHSAHFSYYTSVTTNLPRDSLKEIDLSLTTGDKL